MSKDYERGVEQASAIYKEVIHGYAVENAKLRESLEFANNEWESENAKIQELVGRMAKALRVGSGWCNRDCADEFGCDLHGCPIEASMRELGIKVTQ